MKGLLVDGGDGLIYVLLRHGLHGGTGSGEGVADLPADEIVQLPFNPLHRGGIVGDRL